MKEHNIICYFIDPQARFLLFYYFLLLKNKGGMVLEGEREIAQEREIQREIKRER